MSRAESRNTRIRRDLSAFAASDGKCIASGADALKTREIAHSGFDNVAMIVEVTVNAINIINFSQSHGPADLGNCHPARLVVS